MNILYYSAHEILEYDEIKLFTEMGHNVFSLGAYQISNVGTGMRGEIPNLYDNSHLRSVSIQCSKENTHQELIDWADIILLMHNARVDVNNHPQPWLKGNWEKFKKSKKPIIWRGIGQSNSQVEKSLQEFKELKIVRHSPKDDTIPHYAGSSALIRFYKDPNEYKDYNGQISRIVNLSQSLFGGNIVRSRGDHMSLPFFKQVVEEFDWKVFGPNNENAGKYNGGTLSFEDLKQMLRFNRVFFYIGTRPANVTLGFIEAWMTGIPVLSIGPEHGNEIYTDQKTFEVHEIIGENGIAGFWSDNVVQAKKYLADLLNNQQLAFEVGIRGRAKAIEIFGKEVVRRDWENFFKSL
jgi:glycosyltransferase involved in cell wall biosynthesis